MWGQVSSKVKSKKAMEPKWQYFVQSERAQFQSLKDKKRLKLRIKVKKWSLGVQTVPQTNSTGGRWTTEGPLLTYRWK